MHKEIQLSRECCLLSSLELAFCPQETPKTEHPGIKEMEWSAIPTQIYNPH